MFFLPEILKGPFNRYYIIAAPSHMPSGMWDTQRVDLTASAYGFVRQLYVSDRYWTQLLDAYAHRDWRYTNQTILDRVCALLQSRRVNAYEVPNPDAPHSSISCSFTDNKTATRYIFLPGNAHLVIQTEERQTFASLQAAESFLASAQLDDEQVNLLLSQLKEDPFSGDNSPPRKRLAQAMVTGTLSVGIASASAGAKSQSAPAPEEFVSSERPPTLGPHDEPGYVAPIPAPTAIPAKPANAQAQSLEECEQRLSEARERLQVQGYQAKYTDEEILALADKGELDDRFIVRFTEYAGDNDYLGQRDAAGNAKYWSTTFNQLENADTDPQTICAVLGIPNYSPAKNYSLVVVDTHAAGAGQAVSIVPTHKKLGEFAIKEMEGLDPEIVQQVMTPEYNAVYAEHMAVFEAEGKNIKLNQDVQNYSSRMFTSDQDKQRFETRAEIHKELGANQCYRGDGATENLLGKQKCGVMETFTYDKNPQMLASMENKKDGKQGAIRITAKPLGIKV